MGNDLERSQWARSLAGGWLLFAVSVASGARADGRLIVLGSSRTLPAPLRCVEGEWLAPVAELLAEFGVKASYLNSTKSLTIAAPGNRTATLTAGVPELITGVGSRLKLAAAPEVENGLFMIPLTGVARWLGLSVRLNKNGDIELNHGIIDMRTRAAGDKFVVEIVGSGPLSFTHNTIDAPLRLYVDIHNAKLLAPERTIEVRHPLLQRIRSSQFSESPGITRVVLDLQGKPKFWIVWVEQSNTIKVVLTSEQSAQPSAPASRPRTTQGTALPSKKLDVDKPPARKAPIPGAMTGLPPMNPHLPTDRKKWKDIVIVVDPGHGGKDSGARGTTGIFEKDLTLDIGQRLSGLLRSTGATVLMTREDDSYPTLKDRVAFAEENKADIFISVHVNASPTPNKLCGTETYYYTDQSLPLAQYVHQSMIASLGRKNNGIRQRKFYVIHHTTMPSVLSETAYINHTDEEQLLSTPEFRQRAAEALFNGVRNFVQLEKLDAPNSRTSTVVGKNPPETDPHQELTLKPD
ncbi:MAG: hypothetical protein AUJ92_10165 [Armatimonadetes bacterium CG2_30_59_28]|nr:AMIN domain-containing protein [Armatimonadota bacterium]OIO94442.1 MAG: hypothetical protein AUJ92_10165 [Armatimonadetes bacterium CG2_30_59_28]